MENYVLIQNRAQKRDQEHGTLKRQGQPLAVQYLTISSLCDTTSRIYGLEKPLALTYMRNSVFFNHAQPFMKEDTTNEDITCAGESAVVSLYKGLEDETIDHLRYRRSCEN